MNFPQSVGALASVGITYYYVGFLRNEKTCYARDGESYRTSLPFPEQNVTETFITSVIQLNIKDSQTKDQPYCEFVRRAKNAGCIGYFVFIRGHSAFYFGRNGELHVEQFPSYYLFGDQTCTWTQI